MEEVERKIEGGFILFYKKGTNIIHNEYGPAIIGNNGIKCWYLNGYLHREDDPAVILENAGKYIYRHWYLNGEKHRENGPAIIHSDGYQEYWYKGEYINCKSYEDFKRIIKKFLCETISNILCQDKVPISICITI